MTDNNKKPSVQPEKSPAALREERVLEYWRTQDVFKRSLSQNEGKKEFIFYDGPPFATGTPHFGHILAGTIKDVVPRYKTMRGFHVPRRWGWDCHGLPVENLIEKELGLATKKDIEALGIGKFNEAARNAVLRYAHVWQEQVPRFGRWVDMENDYRTMDPHYTQSVWWVFKTLYDKGLIYEGFKSMHLCPRCETTLANFEVNQGYKDITDLAVTVQFELQSEPNTFVLAWTTTPWTLPGNIALAVNKDIAYSYVSVASKPEQTFIIASEKISHFFKGEEVTVRKVVTGKELIGLAYKPIFPYYEEKYRADKTYADKVWRIFDADYVSLEKGTGIVHLAPAFGAEDMELAEKVGLPLIHHVGVNGHFKPEVTDFPNAVAKPKSEEGEKDGHQKTDILVIKYLAARGVLFAKEKIVHSYPHCWRCSTPLLNYAASSWFVKVTQFKDALVEANTNVSWVPETVGQGRFGKWLEGARDWAISRSRYWGAPLPVWRSEDGETLVVGSLADIRAHKKARNRYIVVRHGEAENNVGHFVSSRPDHQHHLTERGQAQVAATAAALKKDLAGATVDAVYVSPILRTRETAAVIASELGIDAQNISIDPRIQEIQAGEYDGKSMDAYRAFFSTVEERFTKRPQGGEHYGDIQRRMMEFLFEVDTKHEGKTILIVTHDTPGWLLFAGAQALTPKEAVEMRGTTQFFFENAEVKELSFVQYPHNEQFELDFHRPFIDSVTFTSSKGLVMKRVPEVFDCWFESGSMPYGEACYVGEALPHFDPKGSFMGLGKSKGFPADFIAEGLDQTRGWFYSMMVLGVALFGTSPFRNVVVNGLVLAEDGRKMSKSLNNYPNPMDVINRFGVDAMRYFLISSPVVSAEDLCFSEKSVDEVLRKNINRLDNVLSFYEMYAGSMTDRAAMLEKLDAGALRKGNTLDRWIIARLDQTAFEITEAMEAYQLDKATRPLADFIDDLSTWYVRRSRDRFKVDQGADARDLADRTAALSTTQYVLREAAKLMAPVMPFYAEHLYQRVTGGDYAHTSSVHLETWTEGAAPSKDQKALLAEMTQARAVVTLGLEARAKSGIKVRQPLQKLTTKLGAVFSDEIIELIKDEVNVKEVVQSAAQEAEVMLDTVITEELRAQGIVRDLIRAVQDARKNTGLTIQDRPVLSVTAPSSLLEMLQTHTDVIKKTTQLSGLEFVHGQIDSAEKGIEVGGSLVSLAFK
jgi:isoleucyl-tRNA synthetase